MTTGPQNITGKGNAEWKLLQGDPGDATDKERKEDNDNNWVDAPGWNSLGQETLEAFYVPIGVSLLLWPYHHCPCKAQRFFATTHTELEEMSVVVETGTAALSTGEVPRPSL